MSLNKGEELKDTFLLTDTLPAEIPIIYSNFSLYDFVVSSTEWNNILSIDDKKKYLCCTIPFLFNIKKNNNGFRQITLLHPISQLLLTKFNSIFDKEIIEYFRINDQFSLRVPKGIIRQKKIPFDIDKNEIKNWINKVVKYYYKYNYVKITDFYNSQAFLDSELKFPVLYKIDIQSFFDTIYTHSIEWAYLGSKQIAKKNKNNISNLGSLIDNIFQSSNYGETNGIVVGPEISRVISELVATRIDSLVFNDLKKDNLYLDNEYRVYRFIDDIFIFTNTKVVADKIKKTYEEKLTQFKLRLNNEKTVIENRPFNKEHLWVRFTYNLVKKIENWSDINLIDNLFTTNHKQRSIKFRNDIIQDLKYILNDYPNQNQYILSYLTISLSSIIKNKSYYSIYKEIDMIARKEFKNIKNGINNYNDRVIKIFEIMHYALTLSPTYKNSINFTSACFRVIKIIPRFERFIFKKCELLLKTCNGNYSEISNIILFLSLLNYDLDNELLNSYLDDENDYFLVSIVAYYLSHNNRMYNYPKIKLKVNNIIMNKIDDINYEFPISKKGKYEDATLRDLLADQKILWILDYYSCPIINNKEKNNIKKIFIWIERTLDNLEDKYPFHYIFGKYIICKKQSFTKWELTAEEIRKEIQWRIKNKIESVY